MIEKSEIITLANGLSLGLDTVEKDYVLGWLLWGINGDKDLSSQWYFKGGTSLKKCFFETFRFSEDLDFTVAQPAHLSMEFLRKKFSQITEKIYDEVGIEFFIDRSRFDVKLRENGKYYAPLAIHYNGPLRRKQGTASVKLDLTDDEIVVLKSERKKVHHPYSDEPEAGIWANCYAFEEVVAEKIRALGDRARPRDLYDVVHFFRNREMISNPQLIYNVLTKKCSYKKIPIPNYASIEKHEKIEELESQWHNMLAHQLPSLPPLESFWKELNPFFAWLEGNLKQQHLVSPSDIDGEIFHPGRVVNAFSVDLVVHRIQFAAANRVCVEFMYRNKPRTVEPLSFRRAKSSNRLLCGYEKGDNFPKTFSLSQIHDIKVTNITYSERKYPIEINAKGTVIMHPIKRRSKVIG